MIDFFTFEGMKNLIRFLLFILLSNTLFAQTMPADFNVAADIVVPQHYVITKTDQPLKIDGIPSEAAWGKAAFSANYIDIQGIKTPKYATRMKMLWDSQYLYVYAWMEEPHIWGYLKQRDTVIYYNNDFEVFLDPSDDTHNYAEIEINALGTVWDLLLTEPYRTHPKVLDDWNLNDLQSAIFINGTLNDFTDRDSFWSVEMAIPMASLLELRGRSKELPSEGEQWRVNFSRVNWDHEIIEKHYERKKENGKFLREYNWVWSNQKVINMHQPEKWGYLQFTHQQEATGVEPVKSEAADYQQVLYALFRKIKGGEYKVLEELSPGTEKKWSVVYGADRPMEVLFLKTNAGYEMTVVSIDKKKTYLIDQDGFFRIGG